MTSSSVQKEHIRQHRRETLIYLIVPLIVTVFIVLLGVAIVLLLQRQLQVSILADWMIMVTMFCPALICTTVLCVGLIAAIPLMHRANRAAEKPLLKLNELTQTAADRTAKAADSINTATVKAASRFAFLDYWLNVFDMPTDDKTTKEEPHDSNISSK